jgi:hypothetical protein
MKPWRIISRFGLELEEAAAMIKDLRMYPRMERGQATVDW